jgi:NAD-dependent DNA ligase
VLEVRGEVYMPKKAFLQLNEEKQQQGQPLLPIRETPRQARSNCSMRKSPLNESFHSLLMHWAR